MTQIKVSEVKRGDTIIVPHYGKHTITYIKKSRNYKGSIQLQWDRTPGSLEACATDIKATDLVEKVG